MRRLHLSQSLIRLRRSHARFASLAPEVPRHRVCAPRVPAVAWPLSNCSAEWLSSVKVNPSLSRARTEAHDLLGVARESINFPKDRYLERRRLRTESHRFAEAWAKASFIGGWLGRPGAELLFELAGAVSREQDIVELGSYLGRSTAFLAMGAGSGTTVHAVDPHDQELTRVTTGASLTNTATLFRIHMEEVGVADHVEAHEEVSLEASQSYRGKTRRTALRRRHPHRGGGYRGRSGVVGSHGTWVPGVIRRHQHACREEGGDTAGG